MTTVSFQIEGKCLFVKYLYLTNIRIGKSASLNLNTL